MNFEDLQKTWQAQDARGLVTINADILMKEIQRSQRYFRVTVFWRDARELGVTLWLTWLFLHWAVRGGEWPLYLMSFACFGVGAFIVGDRLIQRRKNPASNDSLKACIQTSLHQVNHQIWLLTHVFWWYLLPIAAALAILVFVFAWHSRHNALVVTGCCVYGVLVILLYWGIYLLNQRVVRKSLEPRRLELEALLASLN